MKWFVISTLILAVAYMGLGCAAYFCLKLADETPPFLTVVKAFFLSQPAKYVPGGIWLFPGRIYLYHRYARLSAQKGVIGLFWELVMMITTATLVGLGTSANLLQETNLLLPVTSILVGGIVIVAIGFNIPSLYRIDWFKQGISRIQLLTKSLETIQFTRYRSKYWILALTAFSISWLIIGSAFYLLIVAIYSNAGGPWLYFGIFSSAWVIGFITLITPGGLGVRETILTLMLSLVLPAPYPLLAAVASRAWWMFAEIAVILVGLAVPIREVS